MRKILFFISILVLPILTFSQQKLYVDTIFLHKFPGEKIYHLKMSNDTLYLNNYYFTVGGGGSFDTAGMNLVNKGYLFNYISTMIGDSSAVTLYEAADDSLSGSCNIPILGSPITGSLSVTQNGFPLRITTDFYYISNKVKILLPVYTYDRIQIIYRY